jgi:magnesium transporter
MPIQKKEPKNIQRAIIDNPRTPNERLVWINIQGARKNEIEYLRKNYSFELRHLHASLSRAVAQRPVVEQTENYLFIILHFPVFFGDMIVPAEIEFFIGRGYFITIHNGNSNALNSFFNLCKKDGKSLLTYEFESSAVLLYEVLDKLITGTLALLDQNSIAIADVERIIFEGEEKHSVSKILLLRRNIVNLRKIMQIHKSILQKLLNLDSAIIPKELIKKHYIELIERTKRIWEILENQKDMIEIFNDANQSLMNNNLNEIIKTLTIISVIVFPLTLFATIFGMNTTASMPLINHPYGFWVILGFMCLGGVLMLLFFKRKKWL